MKKVFVSQMLVDVESRKELLDQAKIPCMIKNERSSGLGGEVPFVEVFPELWVLHDEDEKEAQEIFQDWETAKPEANTEWTCPSCNEVLQKEFTTCWKCGQVKGSKETSFSRPLESYKENKDQDAFKRYFPQGFLVGVILTCVTIWGWEYLIRNQNFQDRNRDGKDDYIEIRNYGVVSQSQVDDNFDGTFETKCQYDLSGLPTKCLIDRNSDGEPDLIEDYTFGRYSYTDILDFETGKVRKRQHYKLGMKVREQIDEDGNGEFEKTILFNEYEDPIATPSTEDPTDQ